LKFLVDAIEERKPNEIRLRLSQSIEVVTRTSGQVLDVMDKGPTEVFQDAMLELFSKRLKDG
jgi:hypothetical protein